MNAVERVKVICKERKIPISRLEKDLGYANAYISQLRKGTFPADRLMEIANYLSVTPEYLLNGTDKKEKSPSITGEGKHHIPDKETLKLLELLETREDIRYLAAASERATPEHVKATAKMFDELYGRNQDK